MDIDLSKLLQSCKSHPSYSTIQVNRAWDTCKFRISKSSQALNRTTAMKKNSSGLGFHLNSTLSVQSKTGPIELGLTVSSKKIVLRSKVNNRSTPGKWDSMEWVDKVYHTYAIPKKLRAVRSKKGTLSLCCSEPAEVVNEVKSGTGAGTGAGTGTGTRGGTGAGNGRKRLTREIVLMKNCGSRVLLRKNEFYNEPYLRNLTEKFEE